MELDLVPDHCLSFYFSFYRASLEDFKAKKAQRTENPKLLY